MTRVVCFTAGGAALAATLLAARPASAQVMCNDAALVPNPTIVTGSNSYEPMVGQLAVKLAAEPSPTSVVFATATATSCAGISSVANAVDLGGSSGRYYTLSGTSIVRNDCTFAAGQKVDVAVSDVFYESCSNLPQPKPADVLDVTGPVQATVFISSERNKTTQYLTYEESRAIYGCGVSSARPLVGFTDPMHVFCRDPEAGPQIILAKSLGLAPNVLIGPKCVNGGSTGPAVAGNVMLSNATDSPSVGFVTTDGLDNVLQTTFSFVDAAGSLRDLGKIALLPFQSLGQTSAYHLDSGPGFTDRQNVRDGHYTIWGYEHLIAKTAGGSPSRHASDFIGWISGAKSSTSFDYFAIQSRAGQIPQCAMRVKRSSDGGLLSPYSPPQPCACAFVAVSAKTIPPGCQLCASDNTCPAGLTCRHSFCE